MFSRNLLTSCLNASVAVRTNSGTTKTFAKDKIDLSGIIVPVPTPFEENEKQAVNYEKLEENVLKWEKTPLRGYCIGGTNGEWPFLTNDEKLGMIKAMKSWINISKLVIAGTTCESTDRTLELSESAIDAGADAVLIMTPSYFRAKMTDSVIIDHYSTIADKISAPLIIYNNPSTTGIDINLSIIEILASHPNIQGIKDSDVAKIGAIVEKTKEKNFDVLAGSAGFLLPSLLMGCSGGMNGLAAILGQELCDIQSLAKANEWQKAREIQKRIILPDFLILRELGPAGLKEAMNLMGYYGGFCRKPLLPVTEDIKLKIKTVLQDFRLSS